MWKQAAHSQVGALCEPQDWGASGSGWVPARSRSDREGVGHQPSQTPSLDRSRITESCQGASERVTSLTSVQE